MDSLIIEKKAHTSYIIIFGIISLCILFGTNNAIFTLVGAFICVIYILKTDFWESVTLLAFIITMATVFKLEPGQTSIITYLELLLVAKELYRTRLVVKPHYKHIILFSFYLLIVQCINMEVSVTATIKMVCYCMILIMCFDQHIEKYYATIFKAFIYGVLLSSIMGLFGTPYFHIADYTTDKTLNLGEGFIVTRFSGLYGDPNYYAVNVILALILSLILFYRKQLRISSLALLVILLVYFASLTNSKSAFFMLALPAMLLIYVCWLSKKYYLSIACGIALVIFIAMILDNKIEIFNIVLQRITLAGENADIFTSDRSLIWKDYYNFFTEHPFHLFFGRGLYYFTLNGAAPHNTYIDLLYQIGIVGGLYFLFIYLKGMKLNLRKGKRNILHFSVAIGVAVLYFFLSELQYFDLPFHLLLIYVAMNISIQPEGAH